MEMEKVWPFDQFHFQEDLALYYLHLKEYNVEETIKTAVFDIDELIQLLIILKKRKMKDFMYPGMGNKGSRAGVRLRERDQGEMGNRNYLLME